MAPVQRKQKIINKRVNSLLKYLENFSPTKKITNEIRHTHNWCSFKSVFYVLLFVQSVFRFESGMLTTLAHGSLFLIKIVYILAACEIRLAYK